jgi:hypothetical protein
MPGPTTQILVALIAGAAAALAAGIAGAFSLFGLLISKEQKVSEFRQAWIDALREDIAVLVAHGHQIQAFFATSPAGANLWTETRGDYVELNKASIRIRLRLNQTEEESKKVLESMKNMETLFGGDLREPKSLIELRRIVDALEHDSPPLLKKEWKRVKRGEPIYMAAMVLALLVFIGAGILAGTLIWEILGYQSIL